MQETNPNNDISKTDLLQNQITLHEAMISLKTTIEGMVPEQNDLAILWDVQNINPGTRAPFVDGLLEYVSDYGRLVVAKAFGDWSQPQIKKMSVPLSQNGFEMIHVPDIVKKKNASDMEMITHGIEIVMRYPNIQRYFIVASDIDFRPLINALRRNGKKITVIYDHNRVIDALLSVADDILDYRQLFPGGDMDEDEKDEIEVLDEITEVEPSVDTQRGSFPVDSLTSGITKTVTLTDPKRLEEAYSLLVEAIQGIEDNQVVPTWGAVKVKMKVLRPTFNESDLGFRKWSDFLNKAMAANIIKLNRKDGLDWMVVTDVGKSKYQTGSLPYDLVIKVLTELDTIEFGGDIYEAPAWHLMVHVNNSLKEKGFDYKDYGYKKFKPYLLDLETRGIIQLDIDGFTQYVKLIKS